jgi:hypothetical protein
MQFDSRRSIWIKSCFTRDMCVLMLKMSHRPDGNIADVLAPTHACTTANTSANYRMYVLQRPCKLPIAPMGFSHILRVRLQGGGVYVNGGSVTFSSCTITGNSAGYVRAHAQKFPSPRWDFHMFGACLCLQGGGVMVWGGTVSFSSCTITGNTASGVRAHAQTSHRPNGKIADTLCLETLVCTTASVTLRGQVQSVRAPET